MKTGIFSMKSGPSLNAAKGVMNRNATPFVPQGVPPAIRHTDLTPSLSPDP